MQPFQRILIFFVLPAIAPLLFPPEIIGGAWIAILLDVILFAALGYALTRGRLTALTLMHFLARPECNRAPDDVLPECCHVGWHMAVPNIITSLLSMGISIYLVLRLDRVDIRSQMA